MTRTNALSRAAATFRDYRANHLAKDPPQLDKAERNSVMAEICREALAIRDIGWAVEQMEAGARVAREGWNGKGMFVYHVPADSYLARSAAAIGHFGLNAMVPYGAYTAMKTATGEVVPWLCSQQDLLAKDWVALDTD